MSSFELDIPVSPHGICSWAGETSLGGQTQGRNAMRRQNTWRWRASARRGPRQLRGL